MAFEVIQGFNVSKNEAIDPKRMSAADETAMLAIKWVYPGLRVTRLDTSPKQVWICNASAATLGPTAPFTAIGDWEEFTGTDGIDGIDGSQIYTAAGDPSDLLGVDGDFYLNASSGDYFTKGVVTPGEWGSSAGNLTGPQGEIGLTGPVGNDGADGDTYATTSVGPIDFTGAIDPITITVVGSGFDYSVGQPVIVASRGTPSDNLVGNVQSYDGAQTLILETVVYSGVAVAATDLDVNISGAPGPAGYTPIKDTDYFDGIDGVTGKALIHTESDILLDNAKWAAVQGGTPFVATPQNPYSASVQSDTRSPNTTPGGISGPMAKNSISYNGTVWSNNGRWVGQDGTDGSVFHQAAGAPAGGTGVVTDFYINTTNDDYYEKTGATTWTLRGNLQGSPGNDGVDGAGIVEYHHDVTSNLSGSGVMGLPYDFNTACVLHLHVKKGKYIVLPALSGTWPNSKIREIRVSRLNPESDGPGVCKVWGHILSNGMKTFPLLSGETTQPNFPELDVGEVGKFSPTTWANGGYNKWWTGQISGRGMELYSKQRDYTAASVIKTGSENKIQGRFSFRVVDNVCHYGGWFQVKNSNGIYAITDYFQIGPENPFPFLPDPENGVIFGSYNSAAGPAGRAILPLTTTGSAYTVLSFSGSNPGIFPVQETPKVDPMSVALYYDGTQGLTINKVRLEVRIADSEASRLAGFYSRYLTFGGSYTTASQLTATAHYL